MPPCSAALAVAYISFRSGQLHNSWVSKIRGSAPEVITRELYTAEFSDNGERNMNAIQEKNEFDKDEFWKVSDRLEHEGYIQARAMGGYYGITSRGVIHTEETSVAPSDLVGPNQNARTQALARLAVAYEEGGAMADVHYEPMCGEVGMAPGVFIANMKVLEDLGYIEATTIGCFKITYVGLDAVREWNAQNQIAMEFERLESLMPQARGVAFQKLFALILESSEWHTDEGVRTSHEELDAVFSRGREFYLVECKWEKDPIEAEVVRGVFAKLENRAGVAGIIVSM